MIYETKGTEKIGELFKGWEESLIWSAMQGVMGKIYVTDREEPLSAMVILGDFCFFAGQPDRELVSFKPDWRSSDFIIMVPQNGEWAEVIEEVYGEKAKKVTRYAIKKEGDIFDREKLKAMAANLPEGCELKLIDEALYTGCLKEEWSRDFVSQYETWEEYRRMGLGAVVLQDGVIVAGASSYSSYEGGIEIEIGTREEYRRRGLATACGARLVLECLIRGWYPSWDARNLWSVGLSEKLGYHFSHAYDAYDILGY